MNINAIKLVYKFNKEAGLLDQEYSDKRECAYPIEEALEGLNIDYIDTGYCGNPTDLSRAIVEVLDPDFTMKDVNRLDKHLDIIIYSLGSIFKLGLKPQDLMKALSIVAIKNLEKLHSGQDETGKQNKPDNFDGPEEQLQLILDSL